MERSESAGAAARAERSPGRMLGDLFRRERVASFLKCVRKGMSVDVVRVLDVDAQMMLVKSGFTSGGLFLSSNDFNASSNVLRAWRTEKCVLFEQNANAGRDFAA